MSQTGQWGRLRWTQRSPAARRRREAPHRAGFGAQASPAAPARTRGPTKTKLYRTSTVFRRREVRYQT
jgi:hypothetical protein